MKNSETGTLQFLGVLRWVARRCCYKLDTLFDNKVGNLRIANKSLRNIDAKWFVSEFAHFSNLIFNDVQLAR